VATNLQFFFEGSYAQKLGVISAKTSRIQFQNVIGRLTKTGGKRYFYVSAIGSEAEKTLLQFTKISNFISSLCSTALQLTKNEKWTAILQEAFKKFWPSYQLRPVADGNQMLLNF
jgi:hypothetical protein